MRKALSTAMLFLSMSATYGQLKKIDDVKKSLETTNKDTVAWIYGCTMNLGTIEGFLHNWASGGEIASFAVNSIFSGHVDHLNNGKVWSNNLDMTYGLNYAYSTSFIPHKTDDRIDFTSKYGVRLKKSKYFYVTGLFNFKSQFTKGYDYTLKNWDSISTSKFMSPAYFTTAAGMEYRKGSDLSIFVSPLAGRLTLASKDYTSRSPEGAFGVDHDKTMKYEFGAYISSRYVINFSKRSVYKIRLDLYSNYLAKDTKDSSGAVVKKDNPGNISILFDNLFTYKVSKYLNFAFGATFIYDNNFPYSKYVTTNGVTTNNNQPAQNLGWLQVKQVFTLGFEYKFR